MCVDSSNYTEDFLADGLGIGFTDFEKKLIVNMLPEDIKEKPIQTECVGCFDEAVVRIQVCTDYLKTFTSGEIFLLETEGRYHKVIVNFM